MEEKAPFHLIDILAGRLDCMYVSDLTFLSKFDRRRLICILQEIQPEAFSARQWRDALHYICKLQSTEDSQENLRNEMVRCLEENRILVNGERL